MSGSANAALVIAFDARIGALEGELRKVNRALSNTDTQAKSTTASVNGMSRSMATAGQGISGGLGRIQGALTPLLALSAALSVGFGIGNALQRISALADEAGSIGLTVNELQALQIGFEEAGGSADKAAQGIAKFQGMVGDAQRGDRSAMQTLHDLNIAYQNVDGSARSASETTDALIERINAAPDLSAKLSIAGAAVGARNARLFVAAIEEMGGSLQSGQRRLEEMGIHLDQNTAPAIDRLGTKFANLGRTMSTAIANAVALMEPTISSFLDRVQRMMVRVINEIQRMGRTSSVWADPALQDQSNANAQNQVRLNAARRRVAALEAEQPATTIIEGLTRRSREAIDQDLVAARETLRQVEATANQSRDATQRAIRNAEADALMRSLPATPTEQRQGEATGTAAAPRAPPPTGISDAERQRRRDIAESVRLLEQLGNKGREAELQLTHEFDQASEAVETLRQNMSRLTDAQKEALSGFNAGVIAGTVEDAAKRTAEAMMAAGAATEDIEKQIEARVRAFAARMVELNQIQTTEVEGLVERAMAATRRITQANTTFSQGLRAGAGISDDPKKREDTFEFTIGKGVAEEAMGLFDSIAKTLDEVAAKSVTAGEAFLKLSVDFAKAIAMMIAKEAALRALRIAMNAIFPAADGGVKTSSASLAFGGARMAGGAVAGGYTYLVGERGPELFTPSGSGTITSNQGSWGGAPNFIVNNNAPGVVVTPERVDSRTMVAAVNMARTEIAKDYGRSMSTGYGPYSENLMRTHQIRRKL